MSIPKDELDELNGSTIFKKKDLKRWYTKFMHKYPDGHMSVMNFTEMYNKKLRRNKCSDHFAQHIFRAFEILAVLLSF